MRNLKKILALVLALAMAFSFVASAASFPDVEPTSATGQAVDLLTGLNIVGGYPDGTFGPEKEITRAEFLKMLFITLNGKDDDGLFAGNSDKFPDVSGDQWFAPYVNWGVQLGIIGGYPDGTFKPDNNVTVAEAAKMIVTALGFDALDYSFPYGFIDKGIQLGIFENVSGIGADDSALRGNIAVMNYNMLFVTSAPRYGTYIPNTGWVYERPIEKVFGAKSVETELTATSTNLMTNDTITKSGRVALDAVAAVGDEAGIKNVAEGFEFSGNVDALVGHVVEVWFIKDKTASKDDVTLGNHKDDKIVAITDKAKQSFTVAASGIVNSTTKAGEIENGDAYANVNGVDTILFKAYRDANDNPLTVNGDTKRYFWNDGQNQNWVVNSGVTDPAFTDQPRAYNQSDAAATQNITGSYTFVENSDETDRTKDGWDHIYVNYWRTSQVTSVSSSGIAIRGINNGAVIPVEQLADSSILSTVKADDYVNVAVSRGIVEDEIKTIYTVRAAEVLKNVKITGRQAMGLTVDGSFYNIAYYNSVPGGGTGKASSSMQTVKLGDEYNVVLDQGGFIYTWTAVDPETPNYMLITDVGVRAEGLSSKVYTVSGKLADDSDKQFTLAKDLVDAGITIDEKNVFDKSKENGWLNDAGESATDTDIAAIGKLVQYTLNADGEIDSMIGTIAGNEYNALEAGKLYKYDSNDKYLYTKTNEAATPVMSKKVADDTLFFLYDDNDTANDYSDDEFQVVTGASMNSFDNTTVAALTVKADDTGVAEAALINSELGATTGYNTRIAYASYSNGASTGEGENEYVLTYKLIIDGTNQEYETIPVKVPANATQDTINKTLWKEIWGSESKPIIGNRPIYVELNSDGKIVKMYNNPAYLIDVASGSLQANVTAGAGANVYRSSVVGVDTTSNTVTFGMINGSTALGADLLSSVDYQKADGKWYNTSTYGYKTRSTVKLADDAKITIVNGSTNSYVYADVKYGTLADITLSTDGGYGYMSDFVLRHKDNNESNPLEVAEIVFFKLSGKNNTVEKELGTDDTVAAATAVVDKNGTELPIENGVMPDFTIKSTVNNWSEVVKVAGNGTVAANKTVDEIAAGATEKVTFTVTAKEGGKTAKYTANVSKTVVASLKDGVTGFEISASKAEFGKTPEANNFTWTPSVNWDAVYNNTLTMVLENAEGNVASTVEVTGTDSHKLTVTRSGASKLTFASADAVKGDTFEVTFRVVNDVNDSDDVNGYAKFTLTVTITD